MTYKRKLKGNGPNLHFAWGLAKSKLIIVNRHTFKNLANY